MASQEAQTMKHKIAMLVIIAGIFVTGSQALSAADRAMPDEAKAMLKNAVAHYQSFGRKQALADFSAKKPPFADRELYLVCIGPGHLISAHGAFSPVRGTSADFLKDAEGKPLGAAIVDAGSRQGGGSVRYMMINPTSGKAEPKITFAQKVSDDVCGVGVYSPQ
jgi:cytochrome c